MTARAKSIDDTIDVPTNDGIQHLSATDKDNIDINTNFNLLNCFLQLLVLDFSLRLYYC